MRWMQGAWSSGFGLLAAGLASLATDNAPQETTSAPVSGTVILSAETRDAYFRVEDRVNDYATLQVQLERVNATAGPTVEAVEVFPPEGDGLTSPPARDAGADPDSGSAVDAGAGNNDSPGTANATTYTTNETACVLGPQDATSSWHWMSYPKNGPKPQGWVSHVVRVRVTTAPGAAPVAIRWSAQVKVSHYDSAEAAAMVAEIRSAQ